MQGATKILQPNHLKPMRVADAQVDRIGIFYPISRPEVSQSFRFVFLHPDCFAYALAGALNIHLLKVTAKLSSRAERGYRRWIRCAYYSDYPTPIQILAILSFNVKCRCVLNDPERRFIPVGSTVTWKLSSVGKEILK
jgi:hypothetical protein